MNAGAYVVRRALLTLPVLLGVTLVSFGLSWVANDGHMERAYLTERTSPEARARIIEQYGFDDPWHVQYLSYLQRLARLDLGVSHVQNDRPVLDVFGEFLPATLELTLVALAAAVLGGVALGTLSAVRKDTPADHLTRFLALSGVSLPIFWLGLLLKFALATTYPLEVLLQAGWIAKGAFLSVAFAVPVALGLLAARALPATPLSWRRIGAAAAAGLALCILALLLGWQALATALFLATCAMSAGLGILKGTARESPPRWAFLAGLAVVAAAGFGVAASPWAAPAIQEAFEAIPDFPLGGRFSNALILEEGAHPSLTEGPTRLLLVDTALAGDWVAFRDVAWHLVLPGVTLGYASLAVIARMTRSSMLDVLTQDFVRTARAKGLPESQVIAGHARRNALIPVTTVVGLTFGGLLSGAVLTETIFQWPGLGRWSTQAIVAGDTNSVMSFTLLAALIYLLANLIVDVAYSVLDPRVRLQ